MSYSGLVAALTGAFAAAMLAMLWPFITAGLRPCDREGVSFWPLCGALLMVSFAGSKLDAVMLRENEIFTGVIFTAVLVVGVTGEWVHEMLTAPRLEQTSLLVAMLIGSWVSLWCGAWFERHVDGWGLVAWCGAGVLCQAVSHRLSAPVIFRAVQRPDPPDLGALGCHRELWERHPRETVLH
jgi:hypothetical protein